MQIPSLNLICVLLLLQPSPQPFSLVSPDALRIGSLSLFLPKRPTAQQALCLFSPFLIQAENSPYTYPWMSGTCFLLPPCPFPACTSHSSSSVAGHRKAGTKASMSVCAEPCTAAEKLIWANPQLWQKSVFPFSASVSLQLMVLLLLVQPMGPRGWKDFFLVLPQPPVMRTVTIQAPPPTEHP